MNHTKGMNFVEYTNNIKKNKVVILGGGLAGLSAGWILRKKGYEVQIIEKDAIAGGLAITRSQGGYKWDLGPHNFHTNHQHILNFMKRTFTKLYEHTLSSLIYKNGRFITYPLKGLKVIASLPPLQLVTASISFFCARLRMFFCEPSRDGNFQEWVENRFGKILFKEYFHDYPKKVWGIHPREIDKYVAEKRIPVMSLTELIRTALFGKPIRINHPEWTKHNFYLPHGIGALPKFFEEEFIRMEGIIHFDTKPLKIETEGDFIKSILISNDSGEKQLTCDYLLSTIPINDFVNLFEFKKESVKRSASKLDYVASVLLFLKVNSYKVIPAPLLYYSHADVLFSRVSDVGAFSKEMVPEGKNLLCLEFPCTVGDTVWNMSVESLTNHAISVFKQSGILDQDMVNGSFVEKVSHSYPRFRIGFLENLNECQSFVHGFKNCLSFGRQGGFSYINTDGVMNQGFHAAEAVIMSGGIGFSISEWFAIGS